MGWCNSYCCWRWRAPPAIFVASNCDHSFHFISFPIDLLWCGFRFLSILSVNELLFCCPKLIDACSHTLLCAGLFLCSSLYRINSFYNESIEMIWSHNLELQLKRSSKTSDEEESATSKENRIPKAIRAIELQTDYMSYKWFVMSK